MDTHSALLQRDAVRTVRELRRRLGELGETSDREVLLVRVLLDEELLRLLHRVQDVRLAVLVTVCADTKIDLARVLVRLECLSDTWYTGKMPPSECFLRGLVVEK